MTPTIQLSNVLKSAQTATSVSGLSMLLLTSVGALQKKNAASFVTMNGSVSDANEAKEFGFWGVGSNCLNLPAGITPNTSDKIFFFGQTGSYGSQAYLPMFVRNGIFFRTKVNESWGNWYKISLVEMT